MILGKWNFIDSKYYVNKGTDVEGGEFQKILWFGILISLMFCLKPSKKMFLAFDLL